MEYNWLEKGKVMIIDIFSLTAQQSNGLAHCLQSL
jgi:hypothetical protein